MFCYVECFSANYSTLYVSIKIRLYLHLILRCFPLRTVTVFYSTQFHKSVFSIVVEPFPYFVFKQNLGTWLLIIQY
nr:MAG TPA: hypothetical protein [Bacteriophage sp.]